MVVARGRFLRVVSTVLVSLLAASDLAAQPSALAHTYSIVARDTVTGEMGVAVQTHWFAVGRRVPWAKSGVGAIATQSFTNPSFGPRGLALLEEGKSAQEVLDLLIESDEGRDVRQVAVIDAKGNAAAWTGNRCIQAAGHHVGDNYSVQANLMLSDAVWPAMAEAFESSEGPLAERMLASLEAAQAVGGDIRGRQSAAMIVVRGEPAEGEWAERSVDLRVDDDTAPLLSLRRLLRIHRAYEHMNAGDDALEVGDLERALAEYGMAAEKYPENPEVKFWFAVSLANEGQLDRALPIFEEVFDADPNWRTLAARLPGNQLLNVSNEELSRILKMGQNAGSVQNEP